MPDPCIKTMTVFEELRVPGLFLCTAHDNFFDTSIRHQAEEVMFKKADQDGLYSKFTVYSGTSHGNLMRGDTSNPLMAAAMTAAREEMVGFFRFFIRKS